jgi:hypothetical protein
MAAGDHFLQIADLDVGVDFGRCQTAMAEQLLNLPNVGLALQQMRCERMSSMSLKT